MVQFRLVGQRGRQMRVDGGGIRYGNKPSNVEVIYQVAIRSLRELSDKVGKRGKVQTPQSSFWTRSTA